MAAARRSACARTADRSAAYDVVVVPELARMWRQDGVSAAGHARAALPVDAVVRRTARRRRSPGTPPVASGSVANTSSSATAPQAEHATAPASRTVSSALAPQAAHAPSCIAPTRNNDKIGCRSERCMISVMSHPSRTAGPTRLVASYCSRSADAASSFASPLDARGLASLTDPAQRCTYALPPHAGTVQRTP